MQVDSSLRSSTSTDLPGVVDDALSSTNEKVIDLTGNIQYEITSTLVPKRPVSWIKDEYIILSLITSVVLVIIGSSIILALHENTTAVCIGGGMAITGALITAGTLHIMDKKLESS